MDALNISYLRDKAVEMMVEVKAILDRNGVNFWIEYGTFLGAVRNGQMVPWDNEIDIGVFDYSFTNKENFLNDLKRHGYEIKYRPGRIKIYKAGWWLGLFNFDLHLYQVDDNEVAYVSADMPDPSLINTIFSRLEWIISLYDRRKQTVYRFDTIMKLLATKFDIVDQNSIPKKISFKKGPYNSEFSFQLLGEDFCLERSPIDEKTSSLTRLAMLFLGNLPLSWLAILSAIVTKLRPLAKQTGEKQRIPLHFYTNLSEISLCGISFKGPKEREQYLELLYGTSWRIPNYKWRRKDIGIIK